MDSIDEVNLPDNGVCPTCNLLVRDNPATEKLLATRGLKTTAIPYCRCQGYQPPGTPWEMRHGTGQVEGVTP